MSLYTRLIGTESPKIHVHAFMAALGEFERGKMSQAQIVSAFGLNASEEAEAVTLFGKIVPPLETIAMGGFLTLTNVGAAYDTITAALGLGFAQIECAGISAFQFRVGMNRNSALGTISWQLWNDTDGSESARIDDTAGVGNKFVSTGQVNVGPLAPGIKTFRVRCKSTTAADDPIYLCSNLLIRRVGIMAADTLHQVLLLAEERKAPLDTEALLKTRLGV